MKEMQELINISLFYGADREYVVASLGNTSYKNKERLWIKASGQALATITEDGFSVLDRNKLMAITGKSYSDDPSEHERQVNSDIDEALITPDRRPSIETLLLNMISYRFVFHLNPNAVNRGTCANYAEKYIEPLFGADALYLPYTDPGFLLFKEIEAKLQEVRKSVGYDPKVIVLQNHGIFVSADTTEEIKSIYNMIFGKISKAVREALSSDARGIDTILMEIVAAIRAIVSSEELKVLKLKNSELIIHFVSDDRVFRKACRSFTTDIVVYCKSECIFLDCAGTPHETTEQFWEEYQKYLERNGHLPKVIVIKRLGVIAIGDNSAQADIIIDVLESLLAISWYAELFGNQHFLSNESIAKINSQEGENYLHKALVREVTGRVKNRISIITCAAIGFGEGIARVMKNNGANVVVADMNEEAGRKTLASINAIKNNSRAIFVRADVTNIISLKKLSYKTVCEFGGLDVLIINTGILQAGGIDEITLDNFDQVTKVNYISYFYCTREAAPVMKLQTRNNEKLYTDIIQINLNFGLAGCKRNLTYAGSKFGCIGLTQSFAIEIAPYRIKVNSICTSEYFEDPLWSDLVNVLFVQHLNTDKVQGAMMANDVKKFYLAQVSSKGMHTGRHSQSNFLYN